MQFVIEVNNVSKTINQQEILSHITLKLEEGKAYGFVGNNGSGKSMLFKTICGFVKPSSGEVIFRGKIIGKDIDFIQNAGVLIESPGFLDELSGYRNLLILAQVNNLVDPSRIREILELVGLADARNKKVKTYSLGMKQRLGIAQVLLEDPNVLILDEPFNGLDKNAVAQFRDMFVKIKEQGKTMLLASHIAGDIQLICDEVFEIDNGIIVDK